MGYFALVIAPGFVNAPDSISSACDIPIAGLGTREVRLGDFESVFETRPKGRQLYDVRLASPLYRSEGQTSEQDFASIDDKDTEDFLRSLRSTLVSWSDPGDDLPESHSRTQDRNANVHDAFIALTQKRSVTSRSNIYQVCHYTALIMIEAKMQHKTWAEVAEQNTYVADIKHALSLTNLKDLWGESIGVLYWVSLVLYSASFGGPQCLFYHGLLGRIFFELTYQYSDWRGAVQPMLTLRGILRSPRS